MPRFSIFKSQENPSSQQDKKPKLDSDSTFETDSFMPELIVTEPQLTGSFGARPFASERSHGQYSMDEKIPNIAFLPGSHSSFAPNVYPTNEITENMTPGTIVPTRPGRRSSRSRTPIPSVHRESENFEGNNNNSAYRKNGMHVGREGSSSELSSRNSDDEEDAAFSRHGLARVSSSNDKHRYGQGNIVTHSLGDEARRKVTGGFSSEEHSPILFSARSEGHSQRSHISHTSSRKYHGEVIRPIFHGRDDRPSQYYFYIVPTGLNIIFQDEEGNEIIRVGKFDGHRGYQHPPKPAPVVVRDEYGRELYRSDDFNARSRSRRRHDKHQANWDGHRHKSRSGQGGRERNYDGTPTRHHDYDRRGHQDSAMSVPMSLDYTAPNGYPYPPGAPAPAPYPPAVSAANAMLVEEYEQQIPVEFKTTRSIIDRALIAEQ